MTNKLGKYLLGSVLIVSAIAVSSLAIAQGEDAPPAYTQDVAEITSTLQSAVAGNAAAVRRMSSIPVLAALSRVGRYDPSMRELRFLARRFADQIDRERYPFEGHRSHVVRAVMVWEYMGLVIGTDNAQRVRDAFGILAVDPSRTGYQDAARWLVRCSDWFQLREMLRENVPQTQHPIVLAERAANYRSQWLAFVELLYFHREPILRLVRGENPPDRVIRPENARAARWWGLSMLNLLLQYPNQWIRRQVSLDFASFAEGDVLDDVFRDRPGHFLSSESGNLIGQLAHWSETDWQRHSELEHVRAVLDAYVAALVRSRFIEHAASQDYSHSAYTTFRTELTTLLDWAIDHGEEGIAFAAQEARDRLVDDRRIPARLQLVPLATADAAVLEGTSGRSSAALPAWVDELEEVATDRVRPIGEVTDLSSAVSILLALQTRLEQDGRFSEAAAANRALLEGALSTPEGAELLPEWLDEVVVVTVGGLEDALGESFVAELRSHAMGRQALARSTYPQVGEMLDQGLLRAKRPVEWNRPLVSAAIGKAHAQVKATSAVNVAPIRAAINDVLKLGP